MLAAGNLADYIAYVRLTTEIKTLAALKEWIETVEDED